MIHKTLGLSLVTILTLATGTHAALIVYDPFTTGGAGYTTGSITGQSPTVTGMTGAWTNTMSGGATVSSTGLTYTGLPTTGGTYVGLNSRSFRELSTPFTATTSGTYWMSYLYQSTEANGGSWQAFETYTNTTGTLGQDSSRRFLIANGAEGWGGGQSTHFAINANSSLLVGLANTTVNLFVIKMDFVNGGNDTFTVWMNPDLGTEPTTGGVSATGDYLFSHVGLFNNNGTGQARFDEFRIGNTFADAIGVIPEPSVALLGGLGVLCLLRRRRA